MPSVPGEAARSARPPSGCATRTPSPASGRRRPTAARPGSRRGAATLNPRAPSTRPARSRIGGTWSMPSMMPLAIDGAAPITTTNMITPWPSWNRMIASGTHATDGIVCRPVIIEPIAARSTLTRATAMPTTAPMTIATTKPCDAALQRDQARGRAAVPGRGAVASNTVNGDGTTYSGFQLAARRTICQPPTTMAIARSFGQVAAQAFCQNGARRTVDRRRRAVGVSSRSRSVATATGALLAELVGDRRGERRDLGRVDAAGPRDRRRRRRRRRGRAGSRAARRSRRGAPPRARCA